MIRVIRNAIKRVCLKYKIEKDRTFLLEEGFREAHRREMNVQIGLESRAVVNADVFQNIYLKPERIEGYVDSRPILIMGMEKNPDVTRKYFIRLKMLDRMDRGLSSSEV
ncbi:hypothetical protein COU54_03975 [Candidatus Pacearchaeota archaeon CG10_big_fil_rev_8_21_14_0_10_31_24]|nr:MAG: hypothetical protein COU54_03975 [Candidatus Pacearchaeota archaeon CG10_big_fil_rev_8_21_14_0_10_31_24]